MAWSTAGRNARAAATAGLIDAVGLHSDDPGAAGTDDEWTGSGYTRQSPSFGSPTGGVVGLTAALSFTGPSLEPALYVSLWGGATFLGAAPIGAGDLAANAAGEYSISALNVTADGQITA